MKNWIKIFFHNIILFCILIILFDISIYYFFAERMRKIAPYYKIGFEQSLGRGYPQFYFENVEERNFDISPNTKTIDYQLAEEFKPYEVWSNAYGCFDYEFKNKSDLKVYLAGDSQTWGYTPFEKKFGTILEQKLNLGVMKCGVTHTGQKHQLSKFLEITANLNYFPSLVIINVTYNDIANDFSYPHTTIIEGFMFDDIDLVEINDKIAARRIPIDELRKKYFEKLYYFSSTREKLKRFLKNYSASMNVIYYALKNYSTSTYLNKILFNNLYNYESKNINSKKIYDLYAYENQYPIYEYYAEANRKVILNWIEHSHKNNYTLIFSLIPHKNLIGIDYYKNFKNFLKSWDSNFWDFEEYIILNKIIPNNLFWKTDEHFNIKGNKIYSEYLHEKIQYLIEQELIFN